jgi:transcriptional regulator with XRE-family HTH domain
MDERDLNQTQIAEMAGVAQSTVKRWLDGNGGPGLYELEGICTGLGIELKIDGQAPENRMELRETNEVQRDLAIWRKKAKEAVGELARIKNGMRKLLDTEISSELPSGVKDTVKRVAGKLSHDDQT